MLEKLQGFHPLGEDHKAVTWVFAIPLPVLALFKLADEVLQLAELVGADGFAPDLAGRAGRQIRMLRVFCFQLADALFQRLQAGGRG